MPHPATPVSRSSVVRGLAWSVPAVAAVAAAPFAAASPSVVYTVAFAASGAGTATPVATTPPVTPAPPTLLVGVAASSGGTIRGAGSALTISGSTTVTFTFDRAVTNITFTLSGINAVLNSGAKGFQDVVALTPAPTRATLANGATGAGTTASPYTVTAEGVNGTVAVTLAGPIRSFSLTLSSARGSATPSIDLLNMRFNAAV